ncbi:MAG: shikimate kinase [Armatimonadota bacterium]
MGCGKSTLGRLLAERLGWRFVDTDRVVEAAAGMTIAEIFTESGEAAFRDKETEAVLGACTGLGQVIATGGGAVMRDANARAMRAAGMVVWLTARAEVIAARTSRRQGRRPLLDGDEDPLIRIHLMLAERGPIYRSVCDRIVDTSDRPPRQMVAELERVVRGISRVPERSR